MTPMQSIEHLSPEQIAKLIDDAQKENDGLRQRATDAETRVALRDAVISILQSDVRQLELQLESIGAGGVSGKRITDDPVLTELRYAHQIIRNALAIMTLNQKDEWARRNEHTGCAGEGTTRANEREAALAQNQGD